MAKGIAMGLLIASLVLLLIYGADVAAASSAAAKKGFLPLDEVSRGAVLGGGAVILSIVGFVISRKEYAPAASALLFVNGGLIVVGMLALIAQGALASGQSSSAIRTVGSTIAMGALLIGLGAWKASIDRKVIVARSKETSQK